VKHSYHCADISSIVFDSNATGPRRRIVKAALLAGNAVLAYDVAIATKDDVMTNCFSLDPDFVKVVADARAARTTFYDLSRQISETEAQLKENERQMMMRVGVGRGVSAGGYQQSLLFKSRDELNQKLSDLNSKLGPASNSYQAAQSSMHVSCQRLLNKYFQGGT
jgi:hypothetical protein